MTRFLARLLAANGLQPPRTHENAFKQSLEQHCESNPSYQTHSLIEKNPWDGVPVKCDMEAAGFKFDESWKLED